LSFYEVSVENVTVNFHRVASTVMLLPYYVRHGCCYSQPEELYNKCRKLFLYEVIQKCVPYKIAVARM